MSIHTLGTSCFMVHIILWRSLATFFYPINELLAEGWRRYQLRIRDTYFQFIEKIGLNWN